MAAALVVAAIVVGAPADAAVTADAAPRDLRPVQECADLAACSRTSAATAARRG